jgi:hypothetical protein
MRRALNTLMVSGLAMLVMAAPGFAGDTEKCHKGKDQCCKTTGKPCSSAKAEHDKDKDERHAKKAEGRMNKLTEFTFHQSGGFMGVNKQYDVKLADLNEKDRTELEQLISKSGLLKASGEERMTKGAADMFVYSFSASEGDKHYSITFDDGTLPESYRGLVSFTKDRAVNLKR